MMFRPNDMFLRFKTVWRLTLILSLAALLTGCGVRGSLERPTPAETPEGAEPVVETPNEDDSFILDGLLL
ncbi:MAG: lipoprotein [Pseudomonadota bacterium]